jgi:hypothetical protein
LEHIAAWVAPAATVMTASNLSARVTGWAFAIVTAGSLAGSATAPATGPQNLLLTDGLPTLVNRVGIWRLLGARARYEPGGAADTRRSVSARVAHHLALGRLADAKVSRPKRGFVDKGVSTELTLEMLQALPALEQDDWPVSLDQAA